MPPPVITVPNEAFLEVRIRQRMYGQELMNILHYKYNQASSGRTLLSVSDDVNNALSEEETSVLKTMNACQSQAVDMYAVDILSLIHISEPTRQAGGTKGRSTSAASRPPPRPTGTLRPRTRPSSSRSARPCGTR